MKESFVGCNNLHREMTGDAIASTILEKLEELGQHLRAWTRV